MTTTNIKGGGFYGLRGKQISLILISLVCTTIVIWAWEKNPLLATFVPQQNQFLKPSLDIIVGTPVVSSDSSKQDVYIKENSPLVVSEEETQDKDKGKSSDNFFGTPAVSSDSSKQDVYTKEDLSHVVSEEEMQDTEKRKSSGKEAPIESTSTDIFPQTNETEIAMKTSDVEQKISNSEQKECNYAKGKWVEDSRRPLYSGYGCKQWLSDMWACRLTLRTDFSFEKYRWQPKNCEMPEFEASSFLRRMKDKTIALVGDSLGRQQFQSLMCMASGGEYKLDVIDVGKEYGLVKARGAIRPDGWAYRFTTTNTTILYYWSASLCDLQPLNASNPNTEYAMHLDRPASFLTRYIHRFDVLVLNTGHHWNRGKIRGNRWVMHVGGVPNTNRKIAEIGGAKNFTIYSVVKWLDSELPKYPRLKAFFRTLSPRHFFNGDWNSGGSCDNTTPLQGGNEVTQDKSFDFVASGAVKGTRVKLLDITAVSQLRDEGHMSRYSKKSANGTQDCLHWCLPGIPDTWNELLYAQL